MPKQATGLTRRHILQMAGFSGALTASPFVLGSEQALAALAVPEPGEDPVSDTTGTESEPPELTTAYQVILNAFNTQPDQAFRVRDPHGLLGMPTDDPAMNVTRSRLGRLTRQGFLTQPGRGLYQDRLNAALRGPESARPPAATLA
ncbi:hypothetical protein [Streptomyces sp. NBC_00878]|uniref:hypothetical protein n=1 Tax=Streptomyces sp. NBC_00878 TaxID=2975854 RepID=UPI00225C2E12|nr:hypothetical protein [Streptomyces sp. NBC_00878]MCX4911637.1 hypothetical protein [Streptomyces sp. NBC_00878]